MKWLIAIVDKIHNVIGNVKIAMIRTNTIFQFHVWKRSSLLKSQNDRNFHAKIKAHG